jgi:hypothetical protein
MADNVNLTNLNTVVLMLSFDAMSVVIMSLGMCRGR